MGHARTHRMLVSTVALVGAAGWASASDCRLSVGPDRSSLSFGESAQVSVFGRFPASAYALAGVEFDVFASTPAWTFASDGVIAGGSVLGAGWAQSHQPQTGSVADPSNPMRVWTGVFTPDAPGPALVKIEAVPGAMSVFPSVLTGSSVPCAADPGRAYLWVDPVPVGTMGAAAPGPGTTMDVFPDGHLVATPEEQAILIGLLLPAVQDAGPQPVRREIDWPNEPASFALTMVPAGEPSRVIPPTDQLSLNFTRIPGGTPGAGSYAMSVDAPATLPGNTTVCVWGFTAGVPWCVPGDAVVEIGRVPTRTVTRVVRGPDGDTVLIELHAEEPRLVRVPGVFEGMTDEPVVVRAVVPMRIEMLQGDVVEATGVDGPLGLTWSAPCRADLYEDGVLNFFDVQAFVEAFRAGRHSADFNDDDRLNFFDMQAFLAAFAAGCD